MTLPQEFFHFGAERFHLGQAAVHVRRTVVGRVLLGVAQMSRLLAEGFKINQSLGIILSELPVLKERAACSACE